jgi:YHS domain-containing protein
MYRTWLLASWVFVFPVLFVAGGCGSAEVKEPAKSPPAAAQEKTPEASTEAAEGLKELSEEDRAAAEKQRTCPVSGDLLGAMGKPYKITVEGRTVFLCCPGCEEQFRKDPDKYFAKMKK